MIEQTTATASEWDDCYRGRFFLGGKRLPPSLSAMDSFSVFNRGLAFRGGVEAASTPALEISLSRRVQVDFYFSTLIFSSAV